MQVLTDIAAIPRGYGYVPASLMLSCGLEGGEALQQPTPAYYRPTHNNFRVAVVMPSL